VGCATTSNVSAATSRFSTMNVSYSAPRMSILATVSRLFVRFHMCEPFALIMKFETLALALLRPSLAFRQAIRQWRLKFMYALANVWREQFRVPTPVVVTGA